MPVLEPEPGTVRPRPLGRTFVPLLGGARRPVDSVQRPHAVGAPLTCGAFDVDAIGAASGEHPHHGAVPGAPDRGQIPGRLLGDLLNAEEGVLPHVRPFPLMRDTIEGHAQARARRGGRKPRSFFGVPRACV